jgi:NTP pyrophosphatase (non-canonical NTP hydrolase)
MTIVAQLSVQTVARPRVTTKLPSWTKNPFVHFEEVCSHPPQPSFTPSGVAYMTSRFDDLVTEAIAFRDARDWSQFHTPQQLAAAISIEAAELQEILLWKSEADAKDAAGSSETKRKIAEELSDVLLFSIYLANSLGIDLLEATKRKLKTNAEKYPVELAKGRSDKYTSL